MSLRLHVATRKGLMSWNRDAQQWTAQPVHFLGDTVTQLLPDERDRSLYAVLTLGHFGAKLRRLPAGATEWIECGVPLYPEGAEINDGPPREDGSQKKKPASLKEIWALESAGHDQPGALWAGTIPGGLFRSTDHGATWSIVNSLWDRPERSQWFGGGKDDPGIHSVCVDPANSKRVAIGISCGGAWFSNDGGETWTVGQGMRAEYMPPNLAYEPSAQDPHRMVLCPAKPDRMWVQHHNGVFRSDDFAANWTEITDVRPAPFGFAVVVHPKNPDTAWLVPAVKDEKRVPVDSKVVVSRTRDAGRSFEILSNGLPEPPAYDLVYRHALDIAADGETLAFGSTTGGLWISENGGDTWTCLTHTLPPIYALRFSMF
jgi:hypothetical protein